MTVAIANAAEQINTIKVGDSQIDLLGTAHISKVSRDSVINRIESGAYDAVMVELCDRRYQAMVNPEAIAEIDLWRLIKQKRAMGVIAILALSAYQQRLAEQLNIEAGAEIKVAVQLAEEKNLPMVLIDRDLGITLKRLSRRVPWWKRLFLLSALFAGLVTRQRVTEQEVESLKQGDALEHLFDEAELGGYQVKQTLVDERDQYMALQIIDYVWRQKPQRALVVIGMGHLAGLTNILHQGVDDIQEKMAELTRIPPAGVLPKILPWAVVAVIVAGFIIGFRHSAELGLTLIFYWIVINGGLAAIGALFAGAHSLTVITVFVAAPLTSINPAIGAGMVAAFIELLLRKPKVIDFATLRTDIGHISGWRKNRVARTLLIFFLSTIGSAIGTYLGGIYIYQSII